MLLSLALMMLLPSLGPTKQIAPNEGERKDGRFRPP